jgi:ferredoxin
MSYEKNIKIFVNNFGVTDYCNDSTILEALEKDNFDAPYHCREGFCGTCRATMLYGNVVYAMEPLAFIDYDEILTCVARPISDVELEIDVTFS